MLFNLESAPRYAAERGIPRSELENALRTGTLPAGVHPGGGWVIHPEDLEAWVDGHG